MRPWPLTLNDLSRKLDIFQACFAEQWHTLVCSTVTKGVIDYQYSTVGTPSTSRKSCSTHIRRARHREATDGAKSTRNSCVSVHCFFVVLVFNLSFCLNEFRLSQIEYQTCVEDSLSIHEKERQFQLEHLSVTCKEEIATSYDIQECSLGNWPHFYIWNTVEIVLNSTVNRNRSITSCYMVQILPWVQKL